MGSSFFRKPATLGFTFQRAAGRLATSHLLVLYLAFGLCGRYRQATVTARHYYLTGGRLGDADDAFGMAGDGDLVRHFDRHRFVHAADKLAAASAVSRPR